jgi:hypothetical protein
VATNAMRGQVWDNFSSESYKNQAPSDSIAVRNLYAADSLWVTFQAPQGYYRPASLVSMWATAPFLHNNALGMATHDPSTAGRMRAFNDAVTQLLWPERRMTDTLSVSRTMRETWLSFPASDLPSVTPARVKRLLGADTSAYASVGPIPAGTPVGLLASFREALSAVTLLADFNAAVRDVKEQRLDSAATRARMRQLAPTLLKYSNCVDFIENRGHYYGTRLSDAEKRALIEFLKTL